jgi:hypothetical protein
MIKGITYFGKVTKSHHQTQQVVSWYILGEIEKAHKENEQNCLNWNFWIEFQVQVPLFKWMYSH